MPTDWSGPPHASMLREQLRYWPYTIHQVDETLDVSMIEGRARQILFQGLNAQSITAFVGSGLSASYGRLSWTGWQREQLAVVEQNYRAFKQLARAALDVKTALIEATAPLKTGEKTEEMLKDSARRAVYEANDKIDQKERYNCQQWLKYRRRQIENALDQVEHLYATYVRVKDDSNRGFPGGDGLPVIFEIAQQLQDELRRYVPFFIPEKALASGDKLTPKKTKTWPGSLFENLSAAPNESLKELQSVFFTKEEFDKLFQDSGGTAEPETSEEKAKFVNTFKVYISHLKRYYDVYGQPEAAFDFETLAKLLLVDECAHAMITLREGYQSSNKSEGGVSGDDELARVERELNVFDPRALKRNPVGIREDPDRYLVLTPFLLDRFCREPGTNKSKLEIESLLENGRTAALLRNLQEKLEKIQAGAPTRDRGRLFLTPSSRFLLAMVLALHPQDKRRELVIGKDKTVSGGEKETAARKESDSSNEITLGTLFERSIQNKDFSSRRSIIADELDPLEKIVDHLGVRRFITLNYDFEIERYFVDAGFRHFPPNSVRAREASSPGKEDYRVDGVGRVLYDQTFERQTASNMIRFSVGQNKERAGVFHLHGRASAEDALVITERDYMDLYLLEDDHRETVHEGITMAFSSAPLLFLGLGMSETDLLRPLRQFMSNEDRTSGYRSVALLPAEDSIDARTKFSAALYLRYGVHTIFYGGGVVSAKQENEDDADDVNIDWLYTILSIVKTLRDVLETTKEKPPEIDDPKKIATTLIQKCGPLGKDKSNHQDKSALFAILGVLRKQPSDNANEMETAASELLELVQTNRLQDAVFTPVRQSDANQQSPHYDSSTDLPGKTFTEFYTLILTDVLRSVLGGLGQQQKKNEVQTIKGLMANVLRCVQHVSVKMLETQTESSKSEPKEDCELAREIAALTIAINGLQGAFLTSTLNAALVGLESQWKSWWNKWQDAPPPRLAKFEEVEAPESSDCPKRYVRHPIDNVISILPPDPPSAPFLQRQAGGLLRVSQEWQTRIRAFDTFIEAVAVNRRSSGSINKGLPFGRRRAGRLMMTVAAHRGLGKGTFQSAFISTRGLMAYQQAAWPTRGSRRNPVNITVAAFINFSFATEIASCYDMLAEVLIDQLVRHDPLLGPDTEARRVTLENRVQGVSRLMMLRTLFDAYRDFSARRGSGKSQPRLLIVLNALDLLYDQGAPKNEEIRLVLDLLMGQDLNDHPIDLVILASEGGIGWPIGGPASERPLTNLQIDRPDISAGALEQISERTKNGRISVDDPTLPTKKPVNFVHFARQVSPISLLVDNFRVLATGLTLYNDEVLQNYIDALPNGQNKEKAIEEAKKCFQNAQEKFALAVCNQRNKDKIDERWVRGDLPKATKLDELQRIIQKKARSIIQPLKMHLRVALKQPNAELDDLLRGHLKRHFAEHSDWTDIRKYLRYNRFSLTILLAAAESFISHSRTPLEAVDQARDFILTTANRVRNVGEDRREEMVLEAVLAAYRKHHRVGDPEKDVELHQMLIRHMGVIGAPLSSAVIVRLPQLRDYFERIGVEPEMSRRRFVSRTLTALAHRGLVFRISPHPRLKQIENDKIERLSEKYCKVVRAKLDSDLKYSDLKYWRALHEEAEENGDTELMLEDPAWPASEEHRYALHRIVQRYAVSTLGTEMRDPVARNRFAPTIYASMPSTGTRLSRDSYSFLRQLLIALSQYPDLAHGDAALRPWLHSGNARRTRVQALRAALSLSRSTLSVATISRFAGYNPNDRGFLKRGYMETYKVRLRWIIRLAWELSKEGGIDETAGGAVHRRFNHPSLRVQALYRDEIVWVYNELGVISLAQGSLNEALAFLRQAAEYNEPIEGRSRNGPLFDHIDLNHAIVQLERGRLTSTRTRLKRILAAREGRGDVIFATAQGYSCLLDHLTGNIEGLESRFKKVTKSLEHLGDVRASAIMLAHHGRFLFNHDADAGMRCIRAAQAKAETAGHEDVRQQIEISSIAMEHRNGKKEPEHLKRLKEIEAYGRRMDIWNLQVDALKLRAEILLDQGETGSAGSDAIRALSIATKLSMTLRANSALTLYAKVLLHRGDNEGALIQATQALEMAKSIGYHIETSRAQKVATTCRSSE